MIILLATRVGSNVGYSSEPVSVPWRFFFHWYMVMDGWMDGWNMDRRALKMVLHLPNKENGEEREREEEIGKERGERMEVQHR